MGRETTLVKSEEKMTRGEAAEILRKIADRLDNGKIKLEQGKREVLLKVPERVELEIKAEKEEGKKRTKKKLELEIEWVVGDSTKKKEMKIK